MQLHIVSQRDPSTVRSADTVVPKNVGGDRRERCERRIALRTKCLSISRDAIALEILLQDVTAQRSPSSRKMRTAAGTGRNPLLGSKVAALLPFSSLVTTGGAVRLLLEEAIGVDLSGDE